MKQSEIMFAGILVAVVVLGAVLIDNVLPAGTRNTAVSQTGPVLSSGWYCPAPPSGEEFQASMSTANLGKTKLGLRRFAVGASTESAFSQADLKPGFQSVANLSDFGLTDPIAVVDAFGSRSSTDLTVLGKGKGAGSVGCSAQPSNRWLFATASTARGENHYLLVANPFKEEAVIAVRFIEPDKDSVPARLKDLVIPAESERTILLADFFAETASFGLEVTASQGRVVVARYSNITNSGSKGSSLDIGVGAPAADWTFAEGQLPAGGGEQIVMINPGTREALIGVVFMTEGERTAPPALAEVPVPAGRQVTINVGEHLPEGTSHGISIDSTNGEPVVVERRNTGGADKNNGFETSFGTPTLSRRWVVPVGSPSGGNAKLSIVNPGDQRTSIKVTLMGNDGPKEPGELKAVGIEAGRKVTLDLTPQLNGSLFTALVDSTRQPVSVESSLSIGSPYSDVAYNSGRPV